MTRPIRVLLVDDDALVLSGLKMMLAGARTIEVVGESHDGHGVVPADLHHPDVVLRALQAGAAGFLLKDSAPGDIVAAIQAVHAGDGSLSPAIARRLIALVAGDPDTAARQEQARRRLASLTAREHQVAAAIAQGHSNADIAAQLHMSLATVKAHVSRLLAKLGAANRVQIALLVQDAAPVALTTPADHQAADTCRIAGLSEVDKDHRHNAGKRSAASERERAGRASYKCC